MSYFRTGFRLARLILPLAILPAVAAETGVGLGQLSLEDLMQVEVTSVSKKPQKLANVAAAVHVISAEDIRLSGANSLPEVLRLAPGVDSTRATGNRWSVSVRGFAEVFAEKLLVLVDGRNAFNPAFSGVLWQDLQFPLEDIERIEVIRGPAAAIWGSNGMNGVINVITKSAASTQGGQAVAGGGTVEGSYGRVRWGGQNADGSLFYRVYGSAQHAREQRAATGGDGRDAYGHEAAGIRMDGYLPGGARWDVSADYQSNRSDGTAYMYLPSGTLVEPLTERHRTAALRGRYEQTLSDGGNLQFQAAYSNSVLQIPYAFTDDRNTLDFDVQHRFRLGERQEFVWGANYRVSNDTITPSQIMRMNVPSRRMTYLGLFAQDEIGLAERLRLTLGLRADHNPISGWDTEPTARLSWNLQANHTLWVAASRAARAPSRVDSGFNRNNVFIPGLPNILTVLQSTEAQASERLKAAELGLRSQWTPGLSSDLVVFDHSYKDMLRVAGTQTIVPGFPLTLVNVEVKNGGTLALRGIELTTDWRVNSAWRLQLAQTWNQLRSATPVDIDPAGTVPNGITSLRLSWTPESSVNVDAWLRHSGERSGTPSRTQLRRKAFDGFDLRAAWRPTKALELSLTGQNLNNGACDALTGLGKIAANMDVIPTCAPRSLVGQLRYDF